MQEQCIAITATFTAEPIAEVLAFWSELTGTPFKVDFAPYNQVFQQLLDPHSLLSKNDGGVNVVLLRLEDWQRFEGVKMEGQAFAASVGERVERNVQDLLLALKSLSERTPAPCLVFLCPESGCVVVADGSFQELCTRMEESLAVGIEKLSGVYFVRGSDLLTTYPVSDYYDPRGDQLGHIPFTPPLFAALGTMIARTVCALRQAPKKVIVLDCDQTLWKGVCAEDGVWGIEIDAGRRALQEFMVAQHNKGRLICLCSKNNEQDVIGVFEQRQDFSLKREHIVSWRINWKAKSENLRSLAEELHLGLDSFIFIDDDPVICAEMEASCPEVLTLRLPEESQRIPGFLNHVWPLDQLKVTEEDKRRAELYKENRQRDLFREESLGFDDFIAGLLLDVRISEMTPRQLARVSQLTERTNQFNFTSVRRSETEIRALCESGQLTSLVVEVSDRFGDYGLVGAMLFEKAEDALYVDTFLLSCRVLGRGVEHRMLSKLGELAIDRGFARVDLPFVRSAKNQPALDFIDSIGADLKRPSDDGVTFRLPAEFAASVAFIPGSRLAQPDPKDITAERLAPGSVVSASKERAQSSSALISRISNDLTTPEQIRAAVDLHKRQTAPARSSAFEAPRDAIQLQLAKILGDLLGVPEVGATDNFFDLGGHSILAVRLFSEVERVFGKNFPVSTLIRAPTLEQLADLLRDEGSHPAWSSLVAIQPRGYKPPFFCVHAGGGNVLYYRDLARHLGEDQPFYGLQARGLDKTQLYHTTVEEMAAHYISEIRTVQPDGPYFLGGACFGGLVAYEMAQQLRETGDEVALVALFDTNGPGYPRLRPFTKLLRLDKIYGLLRRVEHHWGSLRLLSSADRLAYVRGKARKAKKQLKRSIWKKKKTLKRELYKTVGRDLPPALQKAQYAIIQAEQSYAPRVYPGRVTVFRASKQPLGIYQDPAMGWSGLATGGLDIFEIPGSHGAIIVEPRVSVLASQLASCLQLVQETESKAEAKAMAYS